MRNCLQNVNFYRFISEMLVIIIPFIIINFSHLFLILPAGLCRTCEIFGVAELVMGSTAVLEEKEFKSLSVTAEKWLKISQV